MTKKIFFTALCSFLILGNVLSFRNAGAASIVDRKTLVLYDAASGDIPNSSMMSFTAFPSDAVSLTYSDGATVLDTTLTGSDAYAGWVASGTTTPGFPVLDRTAGIQVNFTLQVESEMHANHNRTGFSVIILDQDAKGIELSFWQNEIWTQSDENTGGLFTHGEGVAFATDAGLIDYQVTIMGDTYTLTGNSLLILSGPVRDYTNFEGFLDPYETPNFLFWGDDTTSARSRVRLRFISVTGSEPVLPTSAVTSISTSVPQPIASSTPPPTATPLPSPTPTPVNTAPQLCPSAWLLVAVMMSNPMLIRKIRRGANHH
jgi:hypothetical protein